MQTRSVKHQSTLVPSTLAFLGVFVALFLQSTIFVTLETPPAATELASDSCLSTPHPAFADIQGSETCMETFQCTQRTLKRILRKLITTSMYAFYCNEWGTAYPKKQREKQDDVQTQTTREQTVNYAFTKQKQGGG